MSKLPNMNRNFRQNTQHFSDTLTRTTRPATHNPEKAYQTMNQFNTRPQTQQIERATKEPKFRQNYQNNNIRIKTCMSQLKYISNSTPIEIFPNEVVFKDIQINQTYEMLITVRNLQKQSRRIRVVQPSLSIFRCDYDTQGAIPAGLTMNLLIQFESNTIGDFHDQLKIITDDHFQYTIPLHAYDKTSEISFIDYINLGFLQTGKEVTQLVEFKNVGKKQGHIELKVQQTQKNMTINPSSFTLNPQETETVRLTFKSYENGNFKSTIQVYVENFIYHKNILVNAIYLDYSRILIDKSGGEVKQLDFGTMYYGESKEIETNLVNNSPNDLEFKVSFKNGQIHMQDYDNLMTPNETGHEQTQKIISCYPQKATIKAYQQTSIVFVCKSKVTEEIESWTRNYALGSKDNVMMNRSQQYTYTAVFEFDQKNDDEKDPVLFLTGKAICPEIKLDRFIFDFNECSVNGNKDIILQIINKNEEQTLDMQFQMIPFFNFNPNKFKLHPNQYKSVIVSFRPKNLGKFNNSVYLYLMNSNYRIELKVVGDCNRLQCIVGGKGLNSLGNLRSQSSHTQKRGGLEQLPKDFLFQRNYVIEQQEFDILGYEDESERRKIKFKDDEDEIDNLREQRDQYLIQQFNKQKYNDYLIKSRKQRENERIKSAIQNKMTILEARRKDYEQFIQIDKQQTKQEEKQQEDKKAKNQRLKCRLLNEDQMGEAPEPNIIQKQLSEVQLINTPKIALSKQKDQLYVTKPIQNYEPTQEKQLQDFKPKSTQQVRKIFPEEPKSFAEERDINKELNGMELQQIFAGPKIVDFENIFIKSKNQRTFWIRNDLKHSIQVRLESNKDELKQTNKKVQIIPSSQTAGFTINFRSTKYQQFKGIIKYMINERHSFNFCVKAHVEPVLLEPSNNHLKFNFQEGNNDMTISQSLTIRNNGNSEGKFNFIHTEQQIFTVYPKEGVVNAKSQQECIVTYKPMGSYQSFKSQETSQYNRDIKIEDEKLVMKVEDGEDQIIRCQGQINEAKCQLKDKVLDLGQIPICEKVSGIIWLKNKDKYSAVYQIDQECIPPHIEIHPMKGKLNPDQMLGIKVLFLCREEIRIRQDIVINLRGGQPLRVDFNVQTILPKVRILENEFDFGEVTTLGNSGFQYMTIVNESDIDSVLGLDLRERSDDQRYVGIECLEIKPVNYNKNSSNLSNNRAEKNDESSIMMSVDYDKEIELLNNRNFVEQEANDVDDIVIYNKKESMDDDIMSQDSQQDDNQKDDKTTSRTYKIKLRANSRQVFSLKFTPNDVRTYNIELPLTLFGYGRLESLSRMIRCEGLKPKFLMEPKILDFKKKIIRQVDKAIPSYIEVTLNNPDLRSLYWKIDTQYLEVDNVFQILPNEGRIDGGQTIIIKASFQPYSQGLYERTIPVYLDKNYSKSAMEINLKGQGTHPKLLFDRKEVILPIVPLNVQSKCVFRVLNDGYENLMLQYNIIQEFGNVGLELDFPEGRNLGITKNKLKVEAKFSYKKPISFSVPVEFYDDQNRSYQIIISGTADNCLMTNYQFVQRYGLNNEYILEFDDNNQIQYVENDSADSEENEQPNSNNTKREGQNTKTKTISMLSSSNYNINLLGYNPIQQSVMERSADQILRWLNYNVLIHGIQNFPGDIIQSNGSQVFELLSYLTGKSGFSYKAKIENSMKKNEKISLLLEQYQNLVIDLKEKNALLNTIRPCYLLSYQDYNSYKKSQDQQFMQINEKNFNYLSNDNWITLIYQIIKVFYLNRISNKNIKAIPNYNNEERQFAVSENFIEGSNIVGMSEGVLLRWLEANYELYTGQSCQQGRVILNMEQSLKDCLIYAYCIYNYVGDSVKRYLSQMKSNCMSEEDYRYNADRLIGLLQEIGLQTHFQQKDFTNPSLREQLLFVCQLYHSLPHYQPKGNPIVFSCVLMEEVQKQIELINNSNRVINYWVKYEGSQDFIKESDQISIQPRSIYKYKMKFVSRLSKKVSGRLTFTNKKESNAQAAALVFELQSNVVDRNSLQTLTIRGKMYSIQETKIDIKNIFMNSVQDVANFEITVINDYGYDQNNANKQKNKQKNKNEKKVRKSSIDNQQNNLNLPPAFFCPKGNIRIRKGQTMELVIQYMPFQLCSHKCKVVFSDENVGEFQYEIIGEAMLPDPIQDIRLPFQLYVDTLYSHEQLIQFRNEMMNNARRLHEQRVRQSQKQEQIEQLIQMNKQWKQNDQVEFQVQLQPQTSSITFPVSFTVQEITRAATIGQFQQKEYKKVQTKTLEQDNLLAQNQNQEVQDFQNIQIQNTLNSSSNKILLQFAFKKAFKDGTHFLVLINENKTDIRVYKIVVSVFPRAIRATLEMKCPVGEEIKQDIPIINGSDSKDWLMKIQWIQDYNSQGSQFSSPRTDRYFSGSKELVVKKKTTANYTISFKPLKVCYQKCKLVIANPINNDQFEYDLIGIGDEPLSQDHIVIECLARQSNPQTLLIQNPYKDKPVTYEVESDLQIIEDGKQQISIAANKWYKYQYSVYPKLGGVYAGSIHFYEMGSCKEKYIWYTMVVNAERPRDEKQVDLQTQVRKPVMFEICIKNPLDEGVIFDVCIDGEYLSGNSLFSIEAHKEGIYELIFSPLKVFNGVGSIAFMNEKLGELWYMLNLASDKSNTVRLPLMKAELGKSISQQIVLENPSDKEVQVNSQLSNCTNFKTSQQVVSIQPYSSETIDVIYYPSEIDKNQQTEIVFKSDQIGDWYYMAQGVGVLPTDHEVKEIHGQLNDILTEQVDFKNPFKDQVNISVSMCQYNSQDHLDHDIFKLLLKKKTMTLQGFQSLIIPFSFQPKQISQYTMCIVVMLNEMIQWKYPIKGITESCMSNIVYNLVTKARINLQQDIQIQLPGLPYDDGLVKQLRFKANIQKRDEQIHNMISKDLQVLGSKRQLINRDDYLVFNLKFSPMKPYKIDNIELVIDCEQGGRWKYRVNLESLEPEPDDVICIESPLNKTTSVSFRLSNKLKVFSYFQAYFSKDSDNDFSVSPKEGELEPFGREPRIFTVSFSPLEYGKSSSAKLIIETESLYWSFVIKGSFPQYKPPERLQYKVDDRLPSNIQSHWDSMKQKRNYLQTNLKKELSPKRNKR